jgi:hypothetical protein
MASESTHKPTPLEMREFTKSDWYGWAGAECPVHADGVIHQPLIGDMEITLTNGYKAIGQIIADKNGMTYTIPEDIDDPTNHMAGFCIECPFETAVIITKSMKTVTTEKELREEFGLEITDW